MGIGPMEVLLVLLIAFIFLGPGRMVEAARYLGRMTRQLRDMGSEFSDLAEDVEEEEPGQRESSSMRPNKPGSVNSEKGSHSGVGPSAGQELVGGNSPVPFRGSGETSTGDGANPTPIGEQTKEHE